MKRIIIFLSISLVITLYSYGGFPHEYAWASSEVYPYEDGGDIVWGPVDNYCTYRINADAYSNGSGHPGTGYAQATTQLFYGTTFVDSVTAWSTYGKNHQRVKHIYDENVNKASLYVKADTWEEATNIISYADSKVTWW